MIPYANLPIQVSYHEKIHGGDPWHQSASYWNQSFLAALIRVLMFLSLSPAPGPISPKIARNRSNSEILP